MIIPHFLLRLNVHLWHNKKITWKSLYHALYRFVSDKDLCENWHEIDFSFGLLFALPYIRF